MIEVSETTEIEGSAHDVWAVLTELDRFGTWNPFIQRARGSTTRGGAVDVQVRPSFGVPLRFHADVYESVPDRELRWRGHVLAEWLASGDHVFAIEPIDEHRVRFVQRETFGGIVPRLARRLLEREARRGFAAMNRALAIRVAERSRSS